MKEAILTFAVIATLSAGAIFTGCESSAQKVENAQSKVQDAEEDLKLAQKNAAAEAQKAAEQQAFMSAYEAKIDSNTTHIAALKVKIKASRKSLQASYEKSVDALEQRNKELKAKMDAYDKGHSDWDAFMQELSHDMGELGASLKAFTVDEN